MQHFFGILECNSIALLHFWAVGELVEQVSEDPSVLTIVVELGLENWPLEFSHEVVASFRRVSECIVWKGKTGRQVWGLMVSTPAFYSNHSSSILASSVDVGMEFEK